MGKFTDLTGKVFGRWTVEYRYGINNSGSVLWMCRCSCGTRRKIRSPDLTRGASTKCKSCLKLPRGEERFNALFKLTQYNARKRGYSFEISKNQFRTLITSQCFYCGSNPGQIINGP